MFVKSFRPTKIVTIFCMAVLTIDICSNMSMVLTKKYIAKSGQVGTALQYSSTVGHCRGFIKFDFNVIVKVYAKNDSKRKHCRYHRYLYYY
jgi:hypothetical protein